jgi:dissimilatory sulfite reductase (desulfoviridin) alpha/beta subunit
MTIETCLIVLGGAVCAGAILGAELMYWVTQRRQPTTIAILRATLEHERARRTMAEHKLAFWIGLRERSIITVDWKREP